MTTIAARATVPTFPSRLRPGFPAPDLAFPEYVELAGLNSHGAKALLQSPADYLDQLARSKRSKAMAEGQLLHTLVLEPHRLDEDFAIKLKVDGRTKEGKAYNEDFAAKAGRRTVVDEDQLLLVQAQATAVWSDPWGRRDLQELAPGGGGRYLVEATFAWEEETRWGIVAMKGRPDFIDWHNHVCIDVKGAADESDFGFDRAIRDYGYYLQEWWYRRALYQWTGEDDWRFVFLVVGKEPPHNVVRVCLSEEYQAFGERQARAAIDRYAECVFLQDWPKRPSDLRVAQPPKWLG